jgi:hypothetical protein
MLYTSTTSWSVEQLVLEVKIFRTKLCTPTGVGWTLERLDFSTLECRPLDWVRLVCRYGAENGKGFGKGLEKAFSSLRKEKTRQNAFQNKSWLDKLLFDF